MYVPDAGSPYETRVDLPFLVYQFETRGIDRFIRCLREGAGEESLVVFLANRVRWLRHKDLYPLQKRLASPARVDSDGEENKILQDLYFVPACRHHTL